MKPILKLLRVPHYIKNLLVFIPLVFSGQLTRWQAFGACTAAFMVFNLTASAVYIINDIRDAEKDGKHPTKRNRPIASGAVSVKQAVWLALVCLGAALLISFFAIGFSYESTGLLAVYFVLNVLYSFGFKNYPLVDVAILAAGFLFRVMYGSAVIQVEMSTWLYLTVIAVSFYMGMGKRRNELAKSNPDSPGETRRSLAAYSYQFLDKNMYMCLTLANVFYALWCADKTQVYNSQYLIWSVPLVLLICMKYNLNIEGDSDGDPVEVLLQDKLLILLVLLYASLMVAIVYMIPRV